MKYLWYAFLGLFSLGCLALLAGVAVIIAVIGYYGSELPDYSDLKNYKPPIVTRLYAGDGRLMAEFAQEKRVFVPIDNVPSLVKNAFISAEDKNFYSHHGIDMFAIARAMISNLKAVGSGKRPRGASTITQQVAKNFLLTNELSYERKIKEAILAYRIESVMSKDRLLELYLNEIFLGARSYGVAAAALQYFDKSLNELTIAEVAYLAALPKAPNNYHPVRKYEAAIKRRNWVISQMMQNGYITKSQAELAKISPLITTLKDNSRKVSAPYFTEKIRRDLITQYGEDSLYGGGLAVRSTISPRLQGIAVNALREGLMAYDKRHGWRGPLAQITELEDWPAMLASVKKPEAMLNNWKMSIVLNVFDNSATIGLDSGEEVKIRLQDVKWARKYLNEGYSLGSVIKSVKKVLSAGDVVMVEPVTQTNKDGLEETHYELRQIPLIQGAIVAMDPHTGRILAMQGGWKYSFGDQFNRATQAKRQPGSAFKPFVYLAALEHGFTPATLVLDAPFVIEDRPGNFWSPTNYTDEYFGPTPIRVGVEKSKNLMTVRLADYLGMDLIADYAKRFGIIDNMPPLLANALGAGETTLIDITNAYAMIVNGGKKITPSLIDRIQDRRGKTVFRHDDRECINCGSLIKWDGQDMPEVPDIREQIADERHSYQMTSILNGVVQRGTGIRIKSLGLPLGGKTGTTNKSKDTWFIGFSPDLAVGVFAGFDEPRSLGKRETGSSVAVPIFKSFMAEALKDQPASPFRIPPGIRQVKINAKTGARAKPGDEKTIWESFIVGNEPTDDIYILDGSGIKLMPSINAEQGSAGQQATTGTGGLY